MNCVPLSLKIWYFCVKLVLHPVVVHGGESQINQMLTTLGTNLNSVVVYVTDEQTYGYCAHGAYW